MMDVNCTRCGKTLRIEKDGDGIHTCTPQKVREEIPTEHLAEFAERFGLDDWDE